MRPKNHVSHNYNKNCSRKFADVLVAAFIVETYIRAQKNKKYWFWYDTKQSWFEKSICYNRILYRQKIFYCPLIRDHYCFYGIIVYCITITVTCVLHILFCASHFSLKLFSIWCDVRCRPFQKHDTLMNNWVHTIHLNSITLLNLKFCVRCSAEFS